MGVSAQEAKAYISLLRLGPLTGYQLSKNAGINSSKIYGLLQRLIDRRFVVASDTQPVRYFPCTPEELLDSIKSDLGASIGSLESSLRAIAKKEKTDDLIAWNTTGRADVMRRAKHIIGQSHENIFLALWPKELPSLRSCLRESEKRGVKLHVVIYGSTSFRRGTVYFHRPSDYPYRERKERRFILTSDHNGALIANFGSNGEGNGLWTQNPGLVNVFRDFVIHEIYIIRIEAAFPEEIEKCFGKNWERIRTL